MKVKVIGGGVIGGIEIESRGVICNIMLIVPVPVSAPISKVNVSVFSTTVSSIVEYVTVS